MALDDPADRHHARAANALPQLLPGHRRRVTTNLVVGECRILLRLERGHCAAPAFPERLHAGPRIETDCASPNPHADAEEILRRRDGQDFSLTDAVSFALTRQRGISIALAFDAHFAAAGFGRGSETRA